MDMHVHLGMACTTIHHMREFGMEATANILASDFNKVIRVEKHGNEIMAEVKRTQPSGRGDTTIGNSTSVRTVSGWFIDDGIPALIVTGKLVCLQ